jgi:hypothetical protein
MRLLSRRLAPGDPKIASVICRLCNGPYWHSETQFADGRMFSSTYDKGVRILSAEDAAKELSDYIDYWDVIEYPEPEDPKVIAWAERLAESGAGYDERGALSAGFGWKLDNFNDWFCSETAAEARSRQVALPVPCLLNPCNLELWVSETIAGRMSQRDIRLTIEERQRKARSYWGFDYIPLDESAEDMRSKLYALRTVIETQCVSKLSTFGGV